MTGSGWKQRNSAKALDVPLFSQFRHFPFCRKRFMVRPGFAIGKVGLSINIKGLAQG